MFYLWIAAAADAASAIVCAKRKAEKTSKGKSFESSSFLAHKRKCPNLLWIIKAKQHNVAYAIII